LDEGKEYSKVSIAWIYREVSKMAFSGPSFSDKLILAPRKMSYVSIGLLVAGCYRGY
jgi:hypothetical protein